MKKWTTQEIEFLNSNFTQLGGKETARRLGRPLSSIYHKAERLKQPPKVRQDTWTENEIGILRRDYPSQGTESVAALLGRSHVSVRHKAWRLGVRAGREAKARSGQTLSKRKEPTCIDSWKKAVKRRDSYTCQRCGLREPLIVMAHHKTHRSHGGAPHDIENGETLCPNCHAMEHALSGRSASGKRYSLDDAKQCREMRSAGSTIDHIAASMGINHKTVYKFILGV